MKHSSNSVRSSRWLVAGALTLGAFAVQAALVEGKTSDGHRYVAGGVGTEEVEALRQEAPAFSLQMISAARTGAYLAGTQVRITAPGNNVILDTTIDGPWLLVDLPGGRYTVRATHSGNTVERQLNIDPARPHRLVLHFDAPVDGEGPTLPANPSPPRVPQ